MKTRTIDYAHGRYTVPGVRVHDGGPEARIATSPSTKEWVEISWRDYNDLTKQTYRMEVAIDVVAANKTKARQYLQQILTTASEEADRLLDEGEPQEEAIDQYRIQSIEEAP